MNCFPHTKWVMRRAENQTPYSDPLPLRCQKSFFVLAHSFDTETVQVSKRYGNRLGTCSPSGEQHHHLSDLKSLPATKADVPQKAAIVRTSQQEAFPGVCQHGGGYLQSDSHSWSAYNILFRDWLARLEVSCQEASKCAAKTLASIAAIPICQVTIN